MDINQINELLNRSDGTSESTLERIDILSLKTNLFPVHGVLKESQNFVSSCNTSAALDALFRHATRIILATKFREPIFRVTKTSEPEQQKEVKEAKFARDSYLGSKIKQTISHSLLNNLLVSQAIETVIDKSDSLRTAKDTINYHSGRINHLNADFADSALRMIEKAQAGFKSDQMAFKSDERLRTEIGVVAREIGVVAREMKNLISAGNPARETKQIRYIHTSSVSTELPDKDRLHFRSIPRPSRTTKTPPAVTVLAPPHN